MCSQIVLCLLATKVPSSHWTPCALKVLDVIYRLYHSAAATSKPAATHLASIQSLLEKAREASDTTQHRAAGHAAAPISQAELDRLSGRTHLFSDMQGSVSLPLHHPPSSFPSCSTSMTLSETRASATRRPATTAIPTLDETIHPVLAEDLRDFAACKVPPTIQTLYDTRSSSGTPRHTGMTMRAETPPLSSPESLENTSQSNQHRFEQNYSHSSVSTERHQYQARYSTPVHASGEVRPHSPETTPTLHQRHRQPAPLYVQPSRSFSEGDNNASSSSSYRGQSQYYTSSSRPPLYQAPSDPSHGPTSANGGYLPSSQSPFRPSPTPAGYSTELQTYYNSRPSMLAGMGPASSTGMGFVSAFDSGAIILDGTWQGFMEQLGF